MEAYRKTALHLYSLNRADRRWILGQLETDQRERLLLMLDELSALGIPRQSELVQAVDEYKDEYKDDEPFVDSNKAPAQAEDGLPEDVRLVRNAAPENLHRLLKVEAPATIAAVLLAHDWPWREIVLDAFNDPVKQSISETIATLEGNLTPKLTQAIVSILAEKLNQPQKDLHAEEVDVQGDTKHRKLWAFFRRRMWQK